MKIINWLSFIVIFSFLSFSQTIGTEVTKIVDLNTSSIQNYQDIYQNLNDKIKYSLKVYGGETATIKLSDNTFIVTWVETAENKNILFAQKFLGNGCPVNSAFKVNLDEMSHIANPTIAANKDNSFIIAWESVSDDGSKENVFVQRFSADTNRIGDIQKINSFQINEQKKPVISFLDNGNYVVCWQSDHVVAQDFNIYAQLFNENGKVHKKEVRINSQTTDNQINPRVCNLSNGSFVIIWQSYFQDDSGYGIFGQLYDNNFNALGNQFQVNTSTVGDQIDPQITSVSSNDFIVIWKNNDIAKQGIYGQIFNKYCEKVDSEFKVNAYTKNTEKSIVTSLSNGGFAITWYSSYQDQNGFDIYVRKYNNQYQAVGVESKIKHEIISDYKYCCLDITASELRDSFGAFWGGVVAPYNIFAESENSVLSKEISLVYNPKSQKSQLETVLAQI
jgi:hypothetical protein